MKTTTTTREYDDAGRMVKETTVTMDDVQVSRWSLYCNCSMTNAYWCPVHGQRMAQPYRITCGTSSVGATEAYLVN